MTLDAFITYCLTKPAVEETLPFGPDTLVMKVVGKVFALTNLEEAEFRINLKCDPQRAVELREQYPGAIIPGYHMNKKHWNTVYAARDELGDRLVEELIGHSYALVVGGLSKRAREPLDLISPEVHRPSPSHTQTDAAKPPTAVCCRSPHCD